MSLLQVNELTFGYEGSFDTIFDEISFSVDTNWKLGFIGRNGKGKTTFLRLLLGEMDYQGSIKTDKQFDYFPYTITEEDMEKTADELTVIWKPQSENWRVICELNSMDVDPELLYRPIKTLSHGERTKVMLAVLFSGENEFLLIDEPTNHLDVKGREQIKEYLKKKNGFILVSHDRDILDAVTDHMLVLNRESIEVVSGNFSTWKENKERADAFAMAENEKHLKEIGKLKTAADRAGRWADKNENTKIGFDPIKEHDRCIATRAYIGAKTKKMQSRVKNFEKRIEREVAEKEGLLKDIEKVADLKVMPMKHYKKCLVECRDFELGYGDNENLFKLTFQLMQGDIIFLNGENGCGKSSLIKAILNEVQRKTDEYNYFEDYQSEGSQLENNQLEDNRLKNNQLENNQLVDNRLKDNQLEKNQLTDFNQKNLAFHTSGRLEVAPNLVISYVNQNASHLSGSLKDYAEKHNLDYSLFLTLLQKLDMSRIQFEKNIEEYSEGQKKKVLLAASLLTPAHLYIWDEPLNYIDIFSRMQIEKLIETYKPTMIVVEHDARFREKLATQIIDI